MQKRFLQNFALFILISVAVGCRGADDYRVLVLGDMHHDNIKYHDLSNNPPEFHYNPQEVKRNLPNSRKFQPAMLAAAAKNAAGVAMVIQTGDLTQGDCGSEKLQLNMFRGAWKMLKKYFPDTPVYFTCGNHDVRGPGAPGAAEKFLARVISRESGKKITATQYSIRQGKDAYIFIESVNGSVDLQYLQQELEKYRDCRYRFVIGHYPVLPIPSSGGCVFFSPEQEKNRQKLWDMLGKADAIVLCGHIHRTALVEYQHKTGRISELVAYSMLSPDLVQPDEMLKGREKYLTLQSQSNQVYQKIMQSIQPDIKEFFFIRNPGGYVVMHVNDQQITTDFYLNNQNKPFASACLRDNKR